MSDSGETTRLQLDDGDIGCLLRDALVEGTNVSTWLLDWLQADDAQRETILRTLHLHGEDE